MHLFGRFKLQCPVWTTRVIVPNHLITSLFRLRKILKCIFIFENPVDSLRQRIFVTTIFFRHTYRYRILIQYFNVISVAILDATVGMMNQRVG